MRWFLVRSSIALLGLCLLGGHPLYASALTESQKIFASDGEGIDLYGTSISVDGNTLVVGVSRDDDGANDAGAIYVYTRLSTGAWGNETELFSSDIELGDWFGWTVSLTGDVLVVGAPLADGPPPLGINKGAAYIFERGPTGWEERSIISASDIDANQQFGEAVATDGTTVAVGVFKDDVNGANSGSVYLFERDMSGDWVQIDKLTRTGGQPNEHFGDDVALDAGRLIVSTHRERTVGTDSGAAYIYHRDATSGWQLEDKLVATDIMNGDQFGYSVAISGDTALIGAPGNRELGTAAGAAYVFKREAGDQWSQSQKITGLDTQEGDRFGLVVGISGPGLAVGTEREDERGFNAGSAYVFYEQSSGDWLQQAKLVASDARAGDNFAHSIDIDSQTVAVGSWNSLVTRTQGAAYVYDIGAGNSCAGTYDLPINQWRLVSLPCQPPVGQATPQNVFGDDIGGAYGTDWILFSYDPLLPPVGGYVTVDEEADLISGRGYWIQNVTPGQSTVSLDMPANSTSALVDRFAGSAACDNSASGCRELSLVTRGPQPTFDMHGYPFNTPGSLSQWRVATSVATSPADCSTDEACQLSEANDALLFFNRVFAYDGAAYDPLEQGNTINPWSGFWAVALDRAELDGASLIINRKP